MASKSLVSDDELRKALEEKQKPKETTNEKQKWITRMLRSARHHHKICPYYDKKTGMCFLTLGSKCDRDGRFEGCQVFVQFLEDVYDKIKREGGILPMDFRDIPMVF